FCGYNRRSRVVTNSIMTLENVGEKSEVVRALSFGVVDEDYLFSFEFVSGINPRLMSPVSFQCRFSMSLIAIKPVSRPCSILTGIFGRQIRTVVDYEG